MLCEKKEYNQIDLKYATGCGEPFAIVFAFPKDGPCVVKGSETDVLNYLKLNLGFCHYNITLWNNRKKFLEEWRINDRNWKVIEKFSGSKKCYICEFKDKKIFNFKTMPKSFIESLEEFSKTKAKRK
jgi:hypothetical protein